MREPVVSAAGLGVGESGTVVDVGSDEALRRRLLSFGIRPGVRLTLAQRGVGGARVVEVAGSRVALDRPTSRTILVDPEEGER